MGDLLIQNYCRKPRLLLHKNHKILYKKVVVAYKSSATRKGRCADEDAGDILRLQ